GFARARIGRGDSGRRIAQDPRAAAARYRAQRVQRSGARARFARRGEHVEAERTGAVDDELSCTQKSGNAPAKRLHRGIAHGEEDEVSVLQALEVGVPAALLGAIPREHDPNARGAQGRDEDLADGTAAQHRGGAKSSGHPSRRHSTPLALALATNRSPWRTRPARISSARGDSTRRWIV